MGKIVTYFFLINGSVALTTSLATFQSKSSLKNDSDSIASFSDKKKIQKKVLVFNSSVSEAQFPWTLKGKDIWETGEFEKAVILSQENGLWTLKLVSSKNQYEEWKEQQKQKTPFEYSETEKKAHVVFPIPKGLELSKFLNGLAQERPYSKYELKEILKEKAPKFKEYLDSKNYNKLIEFIDLFGK